jgi:hypothetical protein
MGGLKKMAMRKEQEEADIRIARRLGLSLDEMQQLVGHWDYSEERSRNGSFHTTIVFRSSAPQKILQKIKGLNANNEVYLDPDALDD